MASQRVEQIARIFANGVERLFSIAHELIIKSGHEEETVRLRGEWVAFDPSQWRTGRDMRIVAPFAAGNKDSLLQRLMIIAQLQERVLASGLPIATADDAYELAKDISMAADVPGDRYWTDPRTIPPPQPQPDYTAAALEIEAQKATTSQTDVELDAQLKNKEIETDAAVKELTARIHSETQIALAQIKAGQAVDLEEVKANLRNAPVELGNRAIEATGSAVEQLNNQVTESINAITEAIGELKAASEAPVKIVRDKGKIVGKEVNGKFIPLEDTR
jgi:hypothetical protein